MASQHRLADAEHVQEALQEHRFGRAHLLFAVPQQMNVGIGNPFIGRQASE
jgi:hypothetical protein